LIQTYRLIRVVVTYALFRSNLLFQMSQLFVTYGGIVFKDRIFLV